MRKTATYVYCDNPDCEAAVEQPSEGSTPDGWYIVVPVTVHSNGGTAQQELRQGFTLCSLECLAAWGLYREEALADD